MSSTEHIDPMVSLLLDGSLRPALLLDDRRRIVHANTAGRSVLQQGTLLKEQDGCVAATVPKIHARLLHCMAALRLCEADPAASPRRRRALSLLSPAGHCMPACLWALQPLPAEAGSLPPPRALLLMPATAVGDLPDANVLEAAFDLTPAEGRLLSLLTARRNLRDAATELRVSVETVRTHLSHIFDKTGIRTQRELLLQAQALFV